MLSIDGFECAGHPGTKDVGNFMLLALAAKQLNAPFIASGGVATGHQLAAAFALGAEGANMGTRFMVTKECGIHPNIKKAIINANENDTTIIFKSFGNNERVFKNETSMKVVELEQEFPGDFEKIRTYVAGDNYRRSFYETGDSTDSCWSCSQNIGLINDEPTCKELIERMMNEAKSIIQGVHSKF